LRPWRLFKKNGVLLSPHAPGFLLLRHGIGIGIGIAALALALALPHWHGTAWRRHHLV
jgi:hypothetical protein